MKIGAIVQARMDSQRFPGKVLHKIAGRPMLQYLLERITRCSSLDAIVVATSEEPSDGPIADFCKKSGVACYQGPLFDVAGRFKEVLDKYQFDGFVRVNGDSPLLDQRLVEKGVKIFRQGGFEIVTNLLKRTYPAGQSIEVLNALTFIKGYKLMQDPQDFEHATKFFYRNCKSFKIFNFVSDKDYSKIQLSVDTLEDLKAISLIITHMNKPHWQYGLEEILRLQPELFQLKQ